MLTPLPASIATIEEAQNFLKALYDNSESFHPDDSAEDIVIDLEGTRLFTDEEATKINTLMDQISDLEGFDPCLYILRLDPDYQMDEEEEN